MKKTKFIFVTGGVLSSLGKGLAAASIGALLKSRGLSVSIQKLDPYLNLDPGTMSPFQHGEVFVTDDGAETDLDLGHYERYLGVPMSRKNTYTAGRIYTNVLNKERQGKYLGGTVQVIPHVTDEVKAAIKSATTPDLDVLLVEIGGTVGDIESQPFLEAIRQLKNDLGKNRCLYVHLTLVPYLKTSGEPKSKPTQHSVKELRSIGIQPDIILCRAEEALSTELKRKIALFCDVPRDAVFSAIDVSNIYEVPQEYHREGIDNKIAKLLRFKGQPDVAPWEKLNERLNNPRHEVTIGLVGKYVALGESYKSLHEALTHGGLDNQAKVRIKHINAEDLKPRNLEKHLGDLDGILIPGGFGDRGVEGMVSAAKYARLNKKPFFGICLGMQCMVIEFARNVAGLAGANSEEFDRKAKDKVIYLMTDWYDHRAERHEKRDEKSDMGGTMRLGSYPCHLAANTLALKAYKEPEINERHRHRFEFNNIYQDILAEKGLKFAGLSPDHTLVEMVELPVKEHPWYLGCQFHPEFKSTPMKPHPLFRDFIKASVSFKNAKA
ncbi:CTP synthase [Deltaproteobacteria bacterium OttesenSCG-928-M10]|nr:CTP synthase [Deltaproteobacteria bacterium OttesenSCG-928-M10]